MHVVGANLVPRHVPRVVLDQVDERAVGRDRVKTEVALQANESAHAHSLGIHDGERGPFARVAGAGLIRISLRPFAEMPDGEES